tara:strand:+ start:455 stop:679 length:225 start_codon:yes stop_codon:yes gene_type:complete
MNASTGVLAQVLSMFPGAGGATRGRSDHQVASGLSAAAAGAAVAMQQNVAAAKAVLSRRVTGAGSGHLAVMVGF